MCVTGSQKLGLGSSSASGLPVTVSGTAHHGDQRTPTKGSVSDSVLGSAEGPGLQGHHLQEEQTFLPALLSITVTMLEHMGLLELFGSLRHTTVEDNGI